MTQESPTATPLSRQDLLHSIAVGGNLTIDRYHTNTVDKALVEGHYYSDKPPGTCALALPFYAAAVNVCTGIRMPQDADETWRACRWVASCFALALPCGIGAAALMAWLVHRVGPRDAAIASLAMTIGGLPLPYATSLWNHSLTVAMISLAIWGLDLLGEERRLQFGRSAMTGFCLAFAVACEFTAGLVCMGLLAYGIMRRKLAFRGLLVGGIGPIALVFGYNWATTGGLFTLPYTYQATFPAMQQGIYAIKWPNVDIALELLFGLTRGLLVHSPFLLMAGAGFWLIAKTTPQRLWLMLALPALQLIVISGREWDWQAGYCYGPRLLMPILPLLALPCAEGLRRFRFVGYVLGTLSVLVVTLATLTSTRFTYSFTVPLIDVVLQHVLRGDFNPNIGQVLGLAPWPSVALYYGILAVGIAWLWQEAGKLDATAPNQHATRLETTGRALP